ncbi:MAG: FliI/YscN family ATPase [Marinosulfonomonas sp.]|nr:FliI/YscN family ATPase [Marinosulfonomonas sp.]
MTHVDLTDLLPEVARLETSKWVGRIREIGRGTLCVAGLSNRVGLGDLVEIHSHSGAVVAGEVLQIDDENLIVLPDGVVDGLRIDDAVHHLGKNEIAPHSSWLGRIIDPYGKAIDGSEILSGAVAKPLRGAPINPSNRRGFGQRLETGLAVFNTMLPLVRGQRIGLFAGSGVGKSTLLGRLATGVQADVVVIAMIGERGREVREFVEKILGKTGMERAVVVAATSDQSPLARRRCAWAGMAVAEFFRDQGQHVLFLADSVTRFADAHREVALAIGEPATLRGYPPSTAYEITALCERAGTGFEFTGDITAIFSVLVAGSEMDEPVADILRGVLDGHIVLDREIAERGRFPSIDLLRSVSRSLPLAASVQENELIGRARRLLGSYEQNQMMIRAGLYTAGTDAEIDEAIAVWPKLDNFIAANELSGIRESFERLAGFLPEHSENLNEHFPT